MNRVLFMLAIILLPTAGHAQFGYFEQQSTWNTRIGNTLAERQAVFAAPMPGSAALMLDARTYMNFGWVNQSSAWAPLNCTSSNADPLRTVRIFNDPYGIQVNNGWNVLRIKNSCLPPTGNDGLALVSSTDDLNWIWTFYQLRRTDNGGGNISWTAATVHKRARTRAAANGNTSPYDGRGMGVDPIYEGGSGAEGACHPSASYALGVVRKHELDAGEIKHAIAWIVTHERVPTHQKIYPCVVPWSTTFPVPPGNPNRANAPVMGERVMLDPRINIDALDVSANTKTILKAFQNYGYIPVDSTVDGETSFFVDNDAQVADGYDYRWSGSSFADNNAFLDYVFDNSRWIPCVEAYPGECAGGPPPVTGVVTPPPAPVNPAAPAAPQNLRKVL